MSPQDLDAKVKVKGGGEGLTTNVVRIIVIIKTYSTFIFLALT